jgi:hypothetical protein
MSPRLLRPSSVMPRIKENLITNVIHNAAINSCVENSQSQTSSLRCIHPHLREVQGSIRQSALRSANWPLSMRNANKIFFLFSHAYCQSARRRGYGLVSWGVGGRETDFTFSITCRSALGLNWHFIQSVWGAISLGVTRQGLETIKYRCSNFLKLRSGLSDV